MESPRHLIIASVATVLPPLVRRIFLASLMFLGGLGVLVTPMVTHGAQNGPAAQNTPVGQNDVRSAPGRLLVEPRPGLSDAEFEKILKPHGAKSAGRINGTNIHIIQLPPHASEKAVAALLAHNPHLKFVELDVLLPPELTANDPYFGSAWHLTKIQAPLAWDSSMGAGVIIAILDSGVDTSHPDLASKLVAGWNFYDNNSNVADVFGHGTQVAGAAAASSNNSLGVTSVGRDAKIMPIRVTDTTGSGYLSQMAQGITWAADHGARVANLSFAGAGGYATVQSAAQYMKNKGGVVVTAAGNYGRAETFAASAATIVVSATDGNDVKASWSSYGTFVDIAAPGTNIWTTTRGGGYGAASGTSVASPVTAGVVALIMAANPSLTAGDVENVLFSTALDIGSAGDDTYYGNGRVNAAAAVTAALAATARDTFAPTLSITSPAAGGTVKGLTAVNVTASDNVGVSRVDLVINGTPLATDAVAPYGFSWDTTKVGDGNVTLFAHAYDAAGNYSSTSVSVKVANVASVGDAVAPSAAITNPLPNAQLTGNVNITANASDNVGVTSVKLYIDGILKSTATGSTLSYPWNTKKVSAGAHALKVEATDAAGNVGSFLVQVLK